MAKDGWNPKPSKVINIPAPAGKVNLNAKSFDDLVTQQGVRIKVYRTSFCPNVKSIDGAEHEIDCPLCGNNGFIDRKPLESIALIQSQNLEKVHKVQGYWDGNSISATFIQGIELQYFTLVELCDFTDIFIERIKRQAGDVDRLKYSCKRVNMLIDSSGIDYYEGIEFNLNENGDIVWKANKAPIVDTIYSVHYEAAIQFRAVQALHVNRFGQISKGDKTTFKKLNEQWMLQKEFLVERKDSLGEALAPNQIRDFGEE
jgi:hypothetical protein